MLDVCLLLEGSYPYVSGGVSTWVHELVTTMKDIRFGLVCISPNSDPTRKLKYDLPPQVLSIKEVYLHDYNLEPCRLRDPRPDDFAVLKNFYTEMLQQKYDGFPQFLKLFRGEECCLDLRTFFSAEEVWELVKYFYRRFGEAMSFIDFFWTWRGNHLPLLQVLNAALPRAKIYHSISTGYAGLLGAIAKEIYGEKFFLTEHGIYTYERMLEISQAAWIFEKEKKNFRAERELSILRRWWIGMFQVMSHLAYRYADQIFTLYEGNKVREIAGGADPAKIKIIPNGINVESFAGMRRQRKATPQIGFVGRVVSIKDVQTFIFAAKRVLHDFPDARFYIIGPTEEEEDYFEECRRLVDGLRIEHKVEFTGQTDPWQYYEFLDLVVLTSLSEAQPYAILEANACGIPVVASDVGACREMVTGKEPLDRVLGASGLITEVANPFETAEAIARLLKDKELYARCSEAGKKRVKQCYDVADLRARYLNVYEQNL